MKMFQTPDISWMQNFNEYTARTLIQADDNIL